MNSQKMRLQQMNLESLLEQIGQANPAISGSTASLVAAQIAAAMARMAFAVSSKHGHDTNLAVERLDSIVARIKKAAERDRIASANLIKMFGRTSDAKFRSSLLREATHEPLSGAYLIVELLEDLNKTRNDVHPSVASDFFGAAILLSSTFTAVMLAVESNVRQESDCSFDRHTVQERSELCRRHDELLLALRSRAPFADALSDSPF